MWDVFGVPFFMRDFLKHTYEMYRDGFRSMTVGRTLWCVVLIKLAIMFLVLKLFFFPDKLSTEYSTDTERSQAVREALINDRN